MLALSIISITFGLIFVIIGTTCVMMKELRDLWGAILVGAILILLGIYGDYQYRYPQPTKKDVLNGKAVYVDTLHINNGDTTHTYEIVWIIKLED